MDLDFWGVGVVCRLQGLEFGVRGLGFWFQGRGLGLRVKKSYPPF